MLSLGWGFNDHVVNVHFYVPFDQMTDYFLHQPLEFCSCILEAKRYGLIVVVYVFFPLLTFSSFASLAPLKIDKRCDAIIAQLLECRLRSMQTGRHWPLKFDQWLSVLPSRWPTRFSNFVLTQAKGKLLSFL